MTRRTLKLRRCYGAIGASDAQRRGFCGLSSDGCCHAQAEPGCCFTRGLSPSSQFDVHRCENAPVAFCWEGHSRGPLAMFHASLGSTSFLRAPGTQPCNLCVCKSADSVSSQYDFNCLLVTFFLWCQVLWDDHSRHRADGTNPYTSVPRSPWQPPDSRQPPNAFLPVLLKNSPSWLSVPITRTLLLQPPSRKRFAR